MQAERETRPLAFTGTAGDFFQIWIVNLCLSILTLGLYSPWAKVRTRQFFAGNLRLHGSSFWFDADPKRIMVGRLIVLGYLGGLSLAQQFAPLVGVGLGLGAVLLYPWVAVRSIAFRHRHTLFRNIRFGFDAGYGDAAGVLLGGPVLVVLTGGLLLPWWQARRQRFLAGNSRFGGTGFGFDAVAGPYYGVYLRALGLATLLVFPLGLAAALLGTAPLLQSTEGGALPPVGLFAGLLAGLAFYAAIALVAKSVIDAGVTNLLYRNASVGPFRFRSTLRPWHLFRLYLTSGLAVAATLGLALPWARVRIARYRAGQLALTGAGDLGEFTRAAEQRASKLGEVASELADAFDLDFGL